MARQYRRDARGRFAGGGGGATARGGTLAARTSLARSRSKLATNATGAQRGAVTRAQNKLRQSKADNRRKLTPAGTGPRVNGRRLGRTAQPPGAANGIRPTGRPAPRNRIRPYKPATANGQMDRIDRQIDSTMKGMIGEMKAMRDRAKKAKPSIDRMNRRLERSNARSIADRGKKGIDGEIARIEISTIGSQPGAKAIRRRAARASAAAARGSKPAARARDIYANQLAYTGPGKPKAGRNNLRPGPRNTQGPPKRRRRKR